LAPACLPTRRASWPRPPRRLPACGCWSRSCRTWSPRRWRKPPPPCWRSSRHRPELRRPWCWARGPPPLVPRATPALSRRSAPRCAARTEDPLRQVLCRELTSMQQLVHRCTHCSEATTHCTIILTWMDRCGDLKPTMSGALASVIVIVVAECTAKIFVVQSPAHQCRVQLWVGYAGAPIGKADRQAVFWKLWGFGAQGLTAREFDCMPIVSARSYDSFLGPMACPAASEDLSWSYGVSV
jgi:hypothetical protein